MSNTAPKFSTTPPPGGAVCPITYFGPQIKIRPTAVFYLRRKQFKKTFAFFVCGVVLVNCPPNEIGLFFLFTFRVPQKRILLKTGQKNFLNLNQSKKSLSAGPFFKIFFVLNSVGEKNDNVNHRFLVVVYKNTKTFHFSM